MFQDEKSDQETIGQADSPGGKVLTLLVADLCFYPQNCYGLRHKAKDSP